MFDDVNILYDFNNRFINFLFLYNPALSGSDCLPQFKCRKLFDGVLVYLCACYLHDFQEVNFKRVSSLFDDNVEITRYAISLYDYVIKVYRVRGRTIK